MSAATATLEDAPIEHPPADVQFEVPISRRGTPTWEMALYYPHQGDWTEEEYLNLDTNRLVEFTDGVLEFLPMPGPAHFRISRFLTDALRSFVEPQELGEVFWAPYSVRVSESSFREPDLGFLATNRIPSDNTPPVGADLVMEIVSPDPKDKRRDYEKKREVYAQARIPEYWIVDPETETITVLVLPDRSNAYTEFGTFVGGQQAQSAVLPGFSIDVDACFTKGRGLTKR